LSSFAAASFGLRKQRAQFRSDFGALTNFSGPAGLIGLFEIVLRHDWIEADRFDARGCLTRGVLGVGRKKFSRRLGLALVGGLFQDRLLLVVQLIPSGLVDQDRDFSGIETGVDPVFGLFIPSKIEDAVIGQP
jgi:hypothetical protein